MPQSKVTVRNRTQADMAQVTEIYGRSVCEETASFEYEPPDFQEMLRRRAALIDADYPYLAAEIDGQVEDYAYAGAYKARGWFGDSIKWMQLMGQAPGQKEQNPSALYAGTGTSRKLRSITRSTFFRS